MIVVLVKRGNRINYKFQKLWFHIKNKNIFF